MTETNGAAPEVLGLRKFKIYTRTGDSGSSSLYTGERLRKDCAFFEAMGNVDELNSCIGIAREFVGDIDNQVALQLEEIQSRLIDVGSAIATPASARQAAKVTHTRYDAKHTVTLEGWIDALDEPLPPLRHFILPGGGKAAACLHQARSVCRRAERSVVALACLGSGAPEQFDGSGSIVSPAGDADGAGDAERAAATDVQVAEDIMDPAVTVYLNRLSDYLFTAARFLAVQEGKPEVTYQKAK